MTTVVAVMARSYTPAMFDDLTDVEHARTFDKPTGVTTLTFDGDLDAETAAAIWARMESASDADQANRANLRVLLAAAEATELDAVGELAVAAMHYWLGE